MNSPGTALVERTLEFFGRLREAGLPVPPARSIDALKAVAVAGSLDEDDYRLALRVNLVATREQERLFEQVFAEYFHGAPDTRRYRRGIRGETMQGNLGHHEKELDQEVTADPGQFTPQDVGRRLDLAERWDPAAPPLEAVIRELARRLATRPSRRTKAARRGGRIDLRRSVRRNTRHGLELVDLTRSARRTRRTRLVMLCDVSGSMDSFNPFLLRLMLGLQQLMKNSRTLVFSTHVTDITAALRTRSVAETLREVGLQVSHWSGGTNIGGALARLNRGLVREGSASSTVVIVISDGYDNGQAEQVGREMAQLQRHVRKIVWINPMYGATTFQVRAAGMKAALPYVDHFLPAFDAKSLQLLVRGLEQV
ncbi:MAG TPA: VWA domain-containing protein [Gammaproteobacteria bacterium]|nr:VWA domain-containing protein [Gammaproteobacteria bacterium]